MMRHRLMSAPLGVLAGYLAAALLLWVFIRHAEWQTLGAALRSAAWPVLAAAVLLRLASLVVASLRWQVLLEPAARVPLRGVMAATLMGMAATAVAPMQAAEFVRPYLLSRRQGVDLGTALGTTVAEWLLDALAVGALFIPAIAWLRLGGEHTGDASWLAVLCGLPLALAGLATLRRLPHWVTGLAGSTRPGDRWMRLRRRIAACCQSFAVGLQALESRNGQLAVAGYSLLFSALTAVSAWMVLVAFGLPVSFASGFLLLGLVTVAGMVPTPGAVGGFHAVCQVGLASFFHLERARTGPSIIALHAVLYVPGAVLGALCFLPWRQRPSGARG
jgi:glycosyltransferase 2 family protein